MTERRYRIGVAVVIVAALGLRVAWVLWVIRRMRGQDGPMLAMTGAIGIAMIAAFLVFGVVRNVPFGSWLMP